MTNKIAVLLPHYNNIQGLRLTLDSLLEETEDFTVFLYDDGSKNINKVEELLTKYSKDLKIVFNVSDINYGIVETLNKGLKQILETNEYAFIARLDAGDVCKNDRFKAQKGFFLENKELGLLGAWVQFVDINRRPLFLFKPPSTHGKLRRAIHCYNPFVHPASMFRVDVVKRVGFYPGNYPALEDHAYFFEIIKKFEVAVIEKVLLEYEVNPESISSTNRREQVNSRIKLFIKEYKFGLYVTYGLFRTIVVSILPQKVLVYLKKKWFYK